jgi:hypothetical protein
MNDQNPSNQNPSGDSKPRSQKTPEVPASQSPSSSKFLVGWVWKRGIPKHLRIPLPASSESSEKKSCFSAREQIVYCLSTGWFSRNALTPYFSTQMVMPMLQHYLATSGRTRSK